MSHSVPMHSTVNATPSEPHRSVDATSLRHDAALPAGCDAPWDAICDAASVQAEHEVLRKSIRDAENCLHNLKALSDLNAANKATVRPHAYDATALQSVHEAPCNPPMPRYSETPRARCISEYTHAQVTPASQSLNTEVDLANITQRYHLCMHCHYHEPIDLPPSPAIDPRPPDLPLIPRSPRLTPGSFSVVNLINPLPTPNEVNLAPSPVLSAPVACHYGPITEM